MYEYGKEIEEMKQAGFDETDMENSIKTFEEEFNKTEAIYQKLADEIYFLNIKLDEEGSRMNALNDKINLYGIMLECWEF